jgi:putative transposase
MPRRGHENSGRRSGRLPGYDYASRGAYFVTICTRDRACLFGEVTKGVVRHTEIGSVVASAWCDLPNHFPALVLDEWVVMPNHLHGIIALTGAHTPTLGVALAAWRARHPVWAPPHRFGGHRSGPGKGSLGVIVGSFKSVTTRQINQLRATRGPPIWQRGYHERIIGDDGMLMRVRRYIANNPRHWSNPAARAPARRAPQPRHKDRGAVIFSLL